MQCLLAAVHLVVLLLQESHALDPAAVKPSEAVCLQCEGQLYGRQLWIHETDLCLRLSWCGLLLTLQHGVGLLTGGRSCARSAEHLLMGLVCGGQLSAELERVYTARKRHCLLHQAVTQTEGCDCAAKVVLEPLLCLSAAQDLRQSLVKGWTGVDASWRQVGCQSSLC